MRDAVLLVGRELGHGAAVRVASDAEERVVAEAAAAARRQTDASFAGSLGGEARAVTVDEHERAAEARRASGVGHALERGEQLLVVGGVVARLAGVARRQNAGRAVERVDLEP